jgi:hydroxyacylglutathione hydrolase
MQISPLIQPLRIPFQVKSPAGMIFDRFVYVFIHFGREITLIDTGVASSEGMIFDTIRGKGRNPEEISRILLTHSHPDHIGAARAIQEATGCSVGAHPNEISWIEDVNLQERERPVPGFHDLVRGSVHVDHVLRDGDFIHLQDDTVLEVLSCPGHSPGSASFYSRKDGHLFSGDTIPVPGDLPIYDDVAASVRSIQKMSAIPGITRLYSSWDMPREDGQVYQRMSDGLGVIQMVHNTVRKAALSFSSPDPAGIAGIVLAEMGIPATSVNPLMIRSITAHLRLLDVPLLTG